METTVQDRTDKTSKVISDYLDAEARSVNTEHPSFREYKDKLMGRSQEEEKGKEGLEQQRQSGLIPMDARREQGQKRHEQQPMLVSSPHIAPGTMRLDPNQHSFYDQQHTGDLVNDDDDDMCRLLER